jgi:DNA-binding NtrC family response regulator
MMKKNIFVVEDDPDLLELISELLAMEGYTVISARSAEQANEVWKSNSEKIDLLLADLTLPGNSSGVTLAEKFGAEKPSLKIIFSSGHALEIARRNYALPAGVNFLQKPFEPNGFWEKIRSVLNS